jgi:hypothetical protein
MTNESVFVLQISPRKAAKNFISTFFLIRQSRTGKNVAKNQGCKINTKIISFLRRNKITRRCVPQTDFLPDRCEIYNFLTCFF